MMMIDVLSYGSAISSGRRPKASTSQRELAADMRVLHFEVERARVLGEGGFAKVYAAHDCKTDAACAAKWLEKPTARADAQREAMILAALQAEQSHPSIIQLLGAAESGEWLFMELATNGELFDLLIARKAVCETTSRTVARGIAAGLAYCHSLGVAHRDVKLENVMLMADDPDAVKIVDFGLAVSLARADDGAPQPKIFHDRAGSPSYRAPEILAGSGYQAPAADVWSFGVTLLTILSGFFPFKEASPNDWRFAQYARAAADGTSAADAVYQMHKRRHRLSAECVDFLDCLLAIDGEARVTMSAAALHPWLRADHDADESHSQAVIYRSIPGDDGHADDAEMDADGPPETAVRVERQRACRDGVDGLM